MTEQRNEPILIAINGPLHGQQWDVNRLLTIGRDADCEIVIPFREVSRRHARVARNAETTSLEDLGSKNGTFVDNQLIQMIVIKDGGVFSIAGVQEFQYISSDATIPLGVGYRSNSIRLDAMTKQIYVKNVLLDPPLSPQQFSLLQILQQNIGGVVSRQALINAVWGEDQAMGVTDQALDALIRRLRDRLAEADPRIEYISTVRGHGVMLENK